jgi:WD40 repeat protein
MQYLLLFGFLITLLFSACSAPPRTSPLSTPTPFLQTIRAENAPQIARVAQFGKGAIRDYAWSYDGKTIALATSLGVYLYTATTLEQKHFIPTDAEVYAIALDPPGTLLAASLGDNSIRIWDARGWQPIFTFSKHHQPVLHLTFSPNGRMLASLGRDGMLHVWNAGTGTEIYSLMVAPDSRFAFSPDGQFIANGGGKFNRHVQIYDASNGKLARHIEIAPDMGGMTFSPNSQWLAFAEANNNAVLLNVDTGQTTRLAHSSFVNNVAFSPDNLLLATTGGENNVRFWDVRTGKSIREFKGYANATLTVAFSPNAESLAAMDTTGDFRIWDLRTGQSFNHQSFLPRNGKLTYSPRENRVALFQGESFTTFDTNGIPQRLPGHAGQTCALAFSADSKLLASGDASGLIHLWDMNTGNAIRVFAGHRGPVCELSFRQDGAVLASKSVNEDTSSRLWDVNSGQNLNVFSSDSNYRMVHLGFSPAGAVLVTTGIRGTIVSDLTTGAGRVLQDHPADVFKIATSPDGKRLVSSSFDASVWVWEMPSGKMLYRLPAHHDQGAATLAFSRDGKWLLTGDQGNTIRLWNAETGQILQTIQGRGIDAGLNPDGTLIAFKPSFIQNDAAFQQIVLWDVSMNQQAHQWSGGERPLAFSPDGRILASGSAKGIITLWGIQ